MSTESDSFDGLRRWFTPNYVMVDERWILLGSANLNQRSFWLNFEFNAETYDPKLASYLCRW